VIAETPEEHGMTVHSMEVMPDYVRLFVEADPTLCVAEIVNRINEITFNSSLLAEFRAIDFVIRLIDQGRLPRGMGPGQYRRINMHRISLDSVFHTLTADSKLDSDFDFFERLRDGGRQAAKAFLQAHFDDIGCSGTIDLGAESRAEMA
jgi:NTE family protein